MTLDPDLLAKIRPYVEALGLVADEVAGLRYGRVVLEVYNGQVQHLAVTENFRVGRASKAKPPASAFEDD